MKEHMEPLFVLYGVNLIVAGHDHAYSRSYPVAFDKRDPNDKAPIYMTLGAGGNRELHARAYLHPEPEEWVAKRDRFEYGYGNWFVQNATHSHFNWVRDGTTTEGVHDHVWIINPHV
ncbi:acid phosphatase [Fragilaria crotonensis]|nr:acid phosphatase [Fragilaria crotonensis]